MNEPQFDLTIHHGQEELTITWPTTRLTDIKCNTAFDHLIACPPCMIRSQQAWRDSLLNSSGLPTHYVFTVLTEILTDAGHAMVAAVERIFNKPGPLNDEDRDILLNVIGGYNAMLASPQGRKVVASAQEQGDQRHGFGLN